jgi:LDH2 family malate/lactate/ureidoglycolate dehydrogenase
MQDFLTALEAGEPLPEDALRDAEGRPVTDPATVVASGWDGLVTPPLAGARGYGLAVAIDVLTAGLAGGAIGRELAVADEAAGLSLVVIAIRPSACGPPGRFDDRVAALAGQIAATPPAGAEPVRAPGARAAAERRRRLREGVPCPVGQWEEMRRALAETIDPPPDPVAAGGAR